MPSDPPTIRASASEPAGPEPTGPEPAEPAPPASPAPEPGLVQQARPLPAARLPEDAGGSGPEPEGPGSSASSTQPRKGPLSFLSGALTSGLLAWLCLGLSGRVVGYYAGHPPHYEAQIAQSIATALKTLIVGMCFLATFSFAFIGVGLLLTFLRSLRPAFNGRAS